MYLVRLKAGPAAAYHNCPDQIQTLASIKIGALNPSGQTCECHDQCRNPVSRTNSVRCGNCRTIYTHACLTGRLAPKSYLWKPQARVFYCKECAP